MEWRDQKLPWVVSAPPRPSSAIHWSVHATLLGNERHAQIQRGSMLRNEIVDPDRYWYHPTHHLPPIRRPHLPGHPGHSTHRLLPIQLQGSRCLEVVGVLRNPMKPSERLCWHRIPSSSGGSMTEVGAVVEDSTTLCDLFLHQTSSVEAGVMGA